MRNNQGVQAENGALRYRRRVPYDRSQPSLLVLCLLSLTVNISHEFWRTADVMATIEKTGRVVGKGLLGTVLARSCLKCKCSSVLEVGEDQSRDDRPKSMAERQSAVRVERDQNLSEADADRQDTKQVDDIRDDCSQNKPSTSNVRQMQQRTGAEGD